MPAASSSALLDRTGSGDLGSMEAVAKRFLADLRSRPEIAGAFTSFDASFPQYLVHVDGDKAAQKGVTASNVMGAFRPCWAAGMPPTSSASDSSTRSWSRPSRNTARARRTS